MQSEHQQQHRLTENLHKLDLRLIGPEYKDYEQSPQLYLLQRLKEGSPWPQKQQSQMHAFLKSITALYNAVPYHNLTHAFDVMIHMDIYLVRYGWQERLQISQQKRVLMLIAAYAHDGGHEGLTNSFYKNSNHPLAIASSSPLQNMHASHLRKQLRQHGLELEASLLEELTEMILKTDNFYHSWLVEHARALKECSESELREPKNAQTIGCLLLHAADLNNTAKLTSVSVLWTNLLYEQFQNQDKLEREKGLSLTCNSFGTFGERIESNVSFLDHLVFPLFKNIAELQPRFLILIEQAEKNKAYWKSLITKLSDK